MAEKVSHGDGQKVSQNQEQADESGEAACGAEGKARLGGCVI